MLCPCCNTLEKRGTISLKLSQNFKSLNSIRELIKSSFPERIKRGCIDEVGLEIYRVCEHRVLVRGQFSLSTDASNMRV